MWLEQTGGGIEGVVCETRSAGCRVWLVPSDGRCGVHTVHGWSQVAKLWRVVVYINMLHNI